MLVFVPGAALPELYSTYYIILLRAAVQLIRSHMTSDEEIFFVVFIII